MKTQRRFDPTIILRSRPKLWLFLLLIAYVVLALQYNVSAPLLGVRSDEHWHLSYVEYVQRHGALPVFDLQKAGLEGRARWEPEAIQPPLYYWLVAVTTSGANLDDIDRLYTPNPHFLGTAWGNLNPFVHQTSQANATLRAGRFISLAFGVLTLLAAYGLARTFASSTVALLATALTAFNPQFLYISTSFSNDMAVAGICSLVIWFTASELGRPLLLRRGFLLGTLIGLATVAKLGGLVLVGVVPMILLVARLRMHNRDETKWKVIAYCAVLITMTFVIPMPWFIRNWRVYGNPFAMPGLYGAMGERQGLIPIPMLYELLVFHWKSYWLDFSPGGVLYGPSWLYLCYGILLLCSGGGLLLAWRKETGYRPYLILISSWIFLYIATLLITMVQAETRMGGGRLLFPISSSLSVLAAFGIYHLFPRRWRATVALFLMALVLSFAIFAWARILKPTYALPERVGSLDELTSAPAELQVYYHDCCELVGYVPPEQPAHSGDQVPLTLVWRSTAPMDTNYSMFVHARTADAQLVGQLDTYHGSGMYPTTLWQPGEIIADTVYVPTFRETETPSLVQFYVGMYDRNTMEGLPAYSVQGAKLESIIAGEAALIPVQWPELELDSATDTVFEGQIQLTSAELPQQAVRPGDVVTVTLQWHALEPIREDYTGFIHLIDPSGNIVAGQDHPPIGGRFPTRLWPEGTVLSDPFHLDLPADLAEGSYELWGGLYRPESVQRLEAIRQTTGERWKDNLVYLETLVVVEPDG